jgi:Adenylate kinase and related kinases
LVLALDVSEEELVKRLLNRGKTSGRSDDTNETVIHQRFTVYKNETAPIAEHYKKLRRFQSIKGEGSVDEIFDLVCQAIDKRMKNLQHDLW